jgi:hypothetical protein
MVESPHGEALFALRKRLGAVEPGCPAGAHIGVELPVEQWRHILSVLSRDQQRVPRIYHVFQENEKTSLSETSTPSPWIMTADRMPPHGEDVLFLTRHGSWFGWRRQEKGDWLHHFDDETICPDADVLCWMPIPAIPEKLKVTHEQLRSISER